jgi:hypothetical protein
VLYRAAKPRAEPLFHFRPLLGEEFRPPGVVIGDLDLLVGHPANVRQRG